MNRATVAAITTALIATFAAPAAAQFRVEPIRGFAGHLVVDARTGTSRWLPAVPSTSTIDVYDNLESPGNFGVASSDPNAIWGDSLTITQTGIVESITITVLNSNASFSSLISAQFLVTLRDAATPVDIANFIFGATFDGGLPPGFYAIASITDLGSAVVPVEIHTHDLVIEQSVMSSAGTSLLGVVSLTPPTVGTSPPSMFVSASNAFGGVPGFHTFAQGPADPGYDLKLNVVDAATPVSWGRVKRLYR